MTNHNKEKYLQFNSSTHRQDDRYLELDKNNKLESNIQAQVQNAQVQNKKEMEPEHIMAKELILNNE